MKSTRGSTRLCAAQALLRQSRGAVPHEQAPGRQKTVIYAHGYEPDYSNIHAHWELANAHFGGDDWVESITFCPNRLNALLKGKRACTFSLLRTIFKQCFMCPRKYRHLCAYDDMIYA